VADIASLTTRLRKRPMSGSVYDGAGHRHAATLNESGLLGILEAGDLNPALRALLPAAVRSALRDDPDPLLRLQLLAEGLIPNLPNGRPVQESSAEIDEALFVTTTCEEAPFPWQRAAAPATRLAEALGALHALPSADFYPFDANTALSDSLVSACAGWPDAAAAPPAPGALPNVPTLIFSGAQDLRTPTSNARRVAALIPDAQLLVVPFTGHSVIGSDFSGCAAEAVAAFFGGGSVGQPILPCAPSADPFAPTPITPTKLAYVHPAPGLSGKPGLTLTAVLDTIVDLNRQVIGATLQADAELPSGSSFGGLRGGYVKLSPAKVQLSRLTFVPGVELSGTFPVKNGQLQTTTLRVTGVAAANGAVRVGSGARVTGTLGGRRFDVDIAKVELSRAGASGGEAAWPTDMVAFPLPGLVEAQPAHLH
jgi:pimeloyl-ACP methyl ester carboxylesterase